MPKKNIKKKKTTPKKTTQSKPRKTISKKKISPKKKPIISIKKKRKVRRRKKKSFSYSIFPLMILVVLISLFIVYALFIFPQTLNKKIKSDLITIYKPRFYDDSHRIFILRLFSKPTDDIQNKAYKKIKEKYGLEIKFEKITSTEDKGINKIVFFKRNKKFNEIIPIYIYWDKSIEEKETTKMTYHKQEAKLRYEKIEEKRRNEKQEKLYKPQGHGFKYCRHIETPFLEEKARIAIVIDDVGYSYNSTYDFLTLGFPVTFAIIPDMPKSKMFYKLFRKYGYELILHIPMEPLKGKQYVEKNALFIDMTDQEIKNRIMYFLDDYPDVIGANNHMGSKAVTDARLMNIVLSELSIRNKLWLDSMTNLNTISKEVASVCDLSYYKRDVFLDNNKDRYSIKTSMEQLIKKAKQKGSAIGIGHIQTKELVPVLKEYYDKRDELGIEFVPLTKM